MSILQDYAKIKQQIGENEFSRIESFLEAHSEILLSDVLYNSDVYKQFESWKRKKQRVYFKNLSPANKKHIAETLDSHSLKVKDVRIYQEDNKIIVMVKEYANDNLTSFQFNNLDY